MIHTILQLKFKANIPAFPETAMKVNIAYVGSIENSLLNLALHIDKCDSAFACVCKKIVG